MLRKIYYRLGVSGAIVVLTAISVLFSVLGTILIFLILGIDEDWKLGLAIAAILPLTIAPVMSSIPLRLLSQLERAEQEKARLIIRLQKSMANVRTLKGLIPICASCKKIRDDSGYWHRLETYLHEHSEARLSHGYCPECAEKLIAEYEAELRARNGSTDNFS